MMGIVYDTLLPLMVTNDYEIGLTNWTVLSTVSRNKIAKKNVKAYKLPEMVSYTYIGFVLRFQRPVSSEGG